MKRKTCGCLYNPFDLIDRRLSSIETLLLEIKHAKTKEPDTSADVDPLNDYIEKKEVAGKLASASTLWKWEKAGKIQSYGIGGKRYYKRSDIENLFTKIKK